MTPPAPRSAALPFFLRRSHDVIERGTITSTAESIDGLLRLEGDRLVIQWRVTRKTDHFGSSIRSDQEADPVREVSLPLGAIAGGVVRRSVWPWSAAKLVLAATDLAAFEEIAGETGLRLDHPAALVLRIRRSDRDLARGFAADLQLALADRALEALGEGDDGSHE